MSTRGRLEDALDFIEEVNEDDDPYDLILAREQNTENSNSTAYQFSRAKTEGEFPEQLASLVRDEIMDRIESLSDGSKELREYSASNISGHKEYIQTISTDNVPRFNHYEELLTTQDFPWSNYVDENGRPPDFQAVLIRDGAGQRLLAFQDVTRSAVLGKDQRLRFWKHADHYVEVDKTILEVPNRVDAIYYDGELILSDQRRFERIFNYMDEFYQVVESTVDKIAESEVPIHSSEMFIEASKSYPNAARLMYAVNERALWDHDAVTMEVFENIIEDFDLSISCESIDGRSGITMESKTQVWEVIRLYNDDYLDSPITEVSYQVSGKDAARETD